MAGPYAQPDETVPSAMFINKAAQQTDPTDDEGRVPILETDGKLHKFFLHTSREYPAFEAMDGTTTPVAVTLDAIGSLLKADANVTHRQSFLGFMKGNQANVDPALLGTALNGTGSFTAPAGTNRVILVFAGVGDSGGAAVLPTAFSWNSLSFTAVVSTISLAHLKLAVWVLPIGDSGSDQTFSIVQTGGSGNNGVTVSVACFDKVDQASPISASAANSNASAAASVGLTLNQYVGRLVMASRNRVGTTNNTSPAGLTDLIVGGLQELSTVMHDATSLTLTGGASGYSAVAGVSLRGAAGTQHEVDFAGIVSGFTGLTIGSYYYVSDTAGLIQTTAGTSSIRVGMAISATEILIQ